MTKYPNTYKFFSPDELRCKCGKCDSTGHEMHPEFMSRVTQTRLIWRRPMIVTSAYRCPAHDKAIGGSGPHPTGIAMDFAIPKEDAHAFLSIVFNMNFKGIGIAQKGDSRFIHIDDLKSPDWPRPRVWTY